MKFSSVPALMGMVSMAMAQEYPSSSDGPYPSLIASSSAVLVPTGFSSPVVDIVGASSLAPASSAPVPAITPAPSSGNGDMNGPPGGKGLRKGTLTYYDCTDTNSVTGTVTDIETSTYCDLCDHVYTTVYSVTWVNVCPTGLTSPVYTITETATGNPASFTPTTCPPDYTVSTKECTACETPSTITVTEPCSTTSTTPAAIATPAPPYTTPPSPKNKPVAGSTYVFPPAKTTGPQQVTVSAATAGDAVQFFGVVVGALGTMFAVMLML